MFKTTFSNAWNPFAFANAGQADEKYIYEKVFRYYSFLLLLLISILTFFAQEILWILTPPKYHSAAMLIGGICAYYAIRALTILFSTGLYSANKVAHTSLVAIVQLSVFVASAMILVPIYEATGLVLSLDIAATFFIIMYGITIKKYFKFRFSSDRLIIAFILLLSIGGYISYMSVSTGNAVNLSIFFKKLALLLFYAFVSYHIILTTNERKKIMKRIKSLHSFTT
jgi:O-antigen/teichoic acid export membrane protein